MSDSKYAIDAFLNWKAGLAAMPAITTRYIGVFSVVPAYDGSGGTEISATDFGGRIPITFSAPTVNTAGISDQIVNNALEDLGNSTAGSTITVAGFGLFDAQTGGNMLTYGALTTSVQVAPNSDFSFAAGAIKEICS